MKKCELTITINKSTAEVFQFTLNPQNTPLWVDSILEEVTNETPTKIGTIYKNVDKNGLWTKYLVTQYIKDQVFEFAALDHNYHVKYIFTPSTEKGCILKYVEWVEKGDIEIPFTIQILEKLKNILEAK